MKTIVQAIYAVAILFCASCIHAQAQEMTVYRQRTEYNFTQSEIGPALHRKLTESLLDGYIFYRLLNHTDFMNTTEELSCFYQSMLNGPRGLKGNATTAKMEKGLVYMQSEGNMISVSARITIQDSGKAFLETTLEYPKSVPVLNNFHETMKQQLDFSIASFRDTWGSLPPVVIQAEASIKIESRQTSLIEHISTSHKGSSGIGLPKSGTTESELITVWGSPKSSTTVPSTVECHPRTYRVIHDYDIHKLPFRVEIDENGSVANVTDMASRLRGAVQMELATRDAMKLIEEANKE